MNTSTILDLLNEIFQTYIFEHMDGNDIYHLGEIEDRRLKDISEQELRYRKSEFKILNKIIVGLVL